MNNRLVVGVVVGQAVVTLVSISYGVSAHSSWEAERQRRVAGERAAVAEMATAMKGASERLSSIEKELERCRVSSRRSVRAPAPPADPATLPERAAAAPLVPSTEEAFTLRTGPLTWNLPAGAEPRAAQADVGPGSGLAAAAWCAGRYDPARGANFAPCPSPAGP